MPETTTDSAVARRTFPEVEAWLDDLPDDRVRTLRALGELLVGVADRPPKVEDAQQFTARHLGLTSYGDAVYEQCELSGVGALTTGLALGERIDEHQAAVGPGEYTEPPGYARRAVGDTVYNHPQKLRAAFPCGTLLDDTACVAAINTKGRFGDPPELTIFVRNGDRDGARTVLDMLTARAAELNPYRGRICRATNPGTGLSLGVIELPPNLTRDTVVVDPDVWREIDLGVRAAWDQHELLNAHGLGARRGVLMVGPPGVGKSAVSAVIAGELVGKFTVIYVEARAGERLLTAVVEESKRLGGPVLLVLEDVDLWCRDRNRADSGGLSELLQAMDIAPDARILTLASTNDAATLDRAAIRTGRFDSIVEVSYPDHAAAGRILATLLDGLPGGEAVDTVAVAAALPPQTSGSDLREIVRRAVLTHAGDLTTSALLVEVGSGRYRAEVPGAGAYL